MHNRLTAAPPPLALHSAHLHRANAAMLAASLDLLAGARLQHEYHGAAEHLAGQAALREAVR